MSEHELTSKSISDLAALMSAGKVSAKEVTAAFLSNLDRHDQKSNAFVALNPERAMTRATTIDALRKSGQELGPLAGIPLAVKDNYLTVDFPTTAGSRVYDATPPKSDARAVKKLREAGTILVGKTNMHEWAYGATNKVSAFGATRNPWNLNHITGGSSGGSGAALASRMVPAALGSDTGGSIRIPSSGCGVCGIKPSYESVSREGVLPLSWSLDAAGPMATSARDLRILLGAMIEDHREGIRQTIAGSRAASLPNRKIRLGVPNGRGFELAPDARLAFELAQETLAGLGAEIVTVKAPDMIEGFAAWKTILHSEATAFHTKFLGSRASDYADGVRIQLEAGRCITASDYLNAQQFRRGYNSVLDTAMSGFDAFIYPTLPVAAPQLDEDDLSFEGVSVSAQDSMTYVAWLANFAGLPALSLPMGFGEKGLPLGLMLMGRYGTDFNLLDIGELFQSATDWHRRTPPLFSVS